jgi:hypothetical protein
MRKAISALLCAGCIASQAAGETSEIYRACGPYGAGIIEAGKTRICIIDKDRIEKAESQKEASRKITDEELQQCREDIVGNLLDPSSYKEWYASTANGGIIDYTATTRGGGPDRKRRRCTDGLEF